MKLIRKVFYCFFEKINCGGSVPYCVDEDDEGNAKCSNSAATSCNNVDGFTCLSEGVFPNPTNCKEYFICSDNGNGELVADQYQCEDFRVFDPSAPQGDYCRFTRNRFCVQVNCNGDIKNILMNYPFFPRARGEIVASCMGANKMPLVFRCPAGRPAILSTIPPDCTPERVPCRQLGRYAFPDDTTKYYECLITSRGREQLLRSCIRNYFFDGRQRRCVINPTTTTSKF